MSKNIEDYLEPVDPPVPFPAITAYKGENTLSSTETLGNVTLKGRIAWTVSTILGNLPLSFLSSGDALKNYRVYGVSGEAGEQTKNLFDKDNLNIVKAYINSNDTIVSYNTNGLIYVPVTTGETYTILGFKRVSSAIEIKWGITTSIPSNGVSCTRTGLLNQSSSVTVTITSGEAYLCIFLCGDSDYNQYGSVEQAIMKNTEIGMIVLDSTAPDHFIPYGYKIPLMITSGEQSDTYPLYIGSTKLGAEEYVDYGEQKVYKRTQNDFPFAVAGVYEFSEGITVISDGQGAFRFKCESGFNIPVNAESVKIPLCKLFEIPLSVGQGGACTFYIGNNRNDKLRIVFYNETDTEISAWQGNSVWRTTDTYQMQGTVKSISFRNTYTTSVDPRSSVYTPMFSNDGSLTEYIPYLQPTDPPVAFTEIITYEGKNVLSSTEIVGEVSITGEINKTL